MIPFLQFKHILQLLEDNEFLDLGVIPWATPILYFGNIKKSKIATLGINPSDKEFLDRNLIILKGEQSRFFTLESLGINSWKDLNEYQYSQIQQTFDNYFKNNPYNVWFKKLDYIVSGCSKSYYFPSEGVCHLDLTPFATKKKWSALSKDTQTSLLKKTQHILAQILKESSINTLILNGNSVVKYLEKISNSFFESNDIKEWYLTRNGEKLVKGIVYTGFIKQIGELDLGKEIRIIGFNHNIQSSFGVSKDVLSSMREWFSSNIYTNEE